jgi:hypothetical protein
MGLILPASVDDRLTRLHVVVLWMGAIAPMFFTFVYTVDGFFLPGYDANSRPTSDLSLGPDGWIQIINFILLGLTMMGSAVAVRTSNNPLSSSRWIPRLIAMFGVGLVIAGIFLTDPMPGYPPGPGVTVARVTLHGALHQIGSVLAFGSLLLACFVAAHHLWRSPHWHGWAVYSLASGLLMMALLAGFGVAMGVHGPAGLLERGAGSLGLAWIALTSLRLATSRSQETG